MDAAASAAAATAAAASSSPELVAELFTELLCHYGTLYAPQLLLIATLSAITVFRREMSCNRCYNDDPPEGEREGETKEEEEEEEPQEGDGTNNNDTYSFESICGSIHCDWDTIGDSLLRDDNVDGPNAAAMLDGVELYCSISQQLIPFWLSVLEHAERARRDLFVKAGADDDNNNKIAALLEKFAQNASYYYDQYHPREYCNYPLLLRSSSSNGAFSDDRQGRGKNNHPVDPDMEIERLLSSLHGGPVSLVPKQYPFLLLCNGQDRTTACEQSATSLSAKADSDAACCFLSSNAPLPSDVQVHILSFLHPHDVVNMSCVNRSCYKIVNGVDHPGTKKSSNKQQQPTRTKSENNIETHHNHPCTTSTALWKTLFYRDYAWILTSWSIGKQALGRSGIDDLHAASSISSPLTSSTVSRLQYSKEFYYTFGLSYMNYVLAGHATMDSCFVGIEGHIYDLSSFVSIHPGSPETVLIQAGGKDATAFFRSIRHSTGARKLAQSMCVVVDTSKVAIQQQQQQQRPASSASTTGSGATKTVHEEENIRSDTVQCGLHPTSATEVLPHDQKQEMDVTAKHGVTVPPVVASPPVTKTTSHAHASSAATAAQLNGPSTAPSSVGASNGAGAGSSSSYVKYNSTTLKCIRDGYTEQEQQAKRSVENMIRKRYISTAIADECNVYYDPFLQEWKVWYLDMNTLEPEFQRIVC